MSFSFDTLSPADFEDLSRDLLGREFDVRFEAFGPGRDGGIDGRHANADGTTILQAKHYRLSDFHALTRTMKRERYAIDRLAPKRYLLTTSRSLTPPNKDSLADLIGPALKARDDIFGSEDLNGLLRKHPDVQKSHVKLWLSGTGMLERILHAASHNFTTLTHADIKAKVHIYAENPSFKAGRDILENNRILIVSGPPGVGKTTLAEMLCYAYLTENWELVAIRSLDDGFARIDDTKRQVFFFDDFLGRIALDVRALSNQDSDLAQFINRIRRTPSARFILTTRAYIYEEARLLSEALSATKLKVANYVLDVGIYTRRIRARILYNHLIVAGVSEAHIQALIESGAIKKIVDHKHYNPRIVQALTEFERVEDIAAADYPKEFLRALNDPHSVWDKAFRTHIAKRCQHLLFAMFVSADHGAEIEDVEEVFGDLHQTLCREFSLPFGPKDFEEALRTLEGSFLVIANGRVSYINPSVRDYLAGYMNDKTLLRAMAPGMATLQAARALFDHFRKIHGTTAQDKASFLKGYVALAPRAETERCWKPIASEPGRSRWHGLACSARIELLVSWWRLSKADAFLRSALNIATGGAGSFGAWEDGRTLPALLADLLKASRNERAATAELIAALEERLVAMLQSDLDPDDIKRIRERIIARQGDLPPALAEEVEKAIHRTIENLPDNLGHIESESTLDDYTKVVAELGASVGADPLLIQRANAAITSRTDQLREGTPEEDNDLSVTGDTPVDVDRFDDDDLKNLFAPLLAEPL